MESRIESDTVSVTNDMLAETVSVINSEHVIIDE